MPDTEGPAPSSSSKEAPNNSNDVVKALREAAGQLAELADFVTLPASLSGQYSRGGPGNGGGDLLDTPGAELGEQLQRVLAVNRAIVWSARVCVC